MARKTLAERKVKALIDRDDFINIENLPGGIVEIKFTGGKCCAVDKFGRVTWQ